MIVLQSEGVTGWATAPVVTTKGQAGQYNAQCVTLGHNIRARVMEDRGRSLEVRKKKCVCGGEGYVLCSLALWQWIMDSLTQQNIQLLIEKRGK